MSMDTRLKDTDNDVISAIPPVISSNPRDKIEPEEVLVCDVLKHQNRTEAGRNTADIHSTAIIRKSLVPAPRYPLAIVWSPSALDFEVNNTVIIQKITIWNICSRLLYITCCGFWGETARLGAKWRCFPRTRYLLAPGLTAELFIQATPREQSTVPSAQIAIQLAASHKRDLVVGYFVIPIVVRFQKYTKPCSGEVETSNNNVVNKVVKQDSCF